MLRWLVFTAPICVIILLTAIYKKFDISVPNYVGVYYNVVVEPKDFYLKVNNQK